MKILGTKFQRKVWNKIKKIPKGEKVSYRYIAKKNWETIRLQSCSKCMFQKSSPNNNSLL